jgi:hypothetical protein
VNGHLKCGSAESISAWNIEDKIQKNECEISYNFFGGTGSHYIAQDGFELEILLPQLPQ